MISSEFAESEKNEVQCICKINFFVFRHVNLTPCPSPESDHETHLTPSLLCILQGKINAECAEDAERGTRRGVKKCKREVKIQSIEKFLSAFYFFNSLRTSVSSAF